MGGAGWGTMPAAHCIFRNLLFDMTLIAILIGTIAAGVGSVWLAAALGFAMLGRFTQHMLSLAAGALMATAFMHLLPEAFESQASAHELFAMLLGGLVFFFCSTRPSCGTTGTSTTTRRCRKVMVLRTRDRPCHHAHWPCAHRHGGSHHHHLSITPATTTAARAAAGPCWRATASMPSATVC